MRTPPVNSPTAKEAVMTENRTDRLACLFDGLREKGEGAFVPLVNLCDPDAATSEAVIEALIAGGADALELGIPFSDPCADGPVIQASAVRALASGATTAGCFRPNPRKAPRHPGGPFGLHQPRDGPRRGGVLQKGGRSRGRCGADCRLTHRHARSGTRMGSGGAGCRSAPYCDCAA